MKFQKTLIAAFSLTLLLMACSGKSTYEKELKDEYVSLHLSEEFKSYWYAGKAELNSYALEQERYGEIHTGQSVLIFVTEPFLSNEQVKADSHRDNNIPILKLNQTKKFNTGIYPYSTMLSVFSPLTDQPNAIKATFSAQEWCGQSYVQLNNKKKYDVAFHSYFESQADSKYALDKELLEDEIWAELRIDPSGLPKGNIKMIPAMEYSVLRHKEVKAYDAIASLDQNEEVSTYTIQYPTLKRTLSIRFNNEFPYVIQSWEETHANGLKTTATLMKTIQLDYWSKHSVEDLPLRDSLKLGR